MFPDELKQFNQWVVWRSVSKGADYTKLPYNARTGTLASSIDPATWTDFNTAATTAQRWMCGIGFMLSEQDPYAFIDLDNAHGNQVIIDRQMKIEETFDSYSERSPSQTGLHIIVKGHIGAGRRRDKVEVYSQERFMTMTGWTFRDKPIEDRSDLLRILWEEIGGIDSTPIIIEERPEEYNDGQIYTTARTAANGDKFAALWDGHWVSYYTSQSEADFALINMLSFYSRNQTQIKRLFLASALGQRDKAKRRAYLDKMIQRSFDNQVPMLDMSTLEEKLREQIIVKSEPEPEPNPFAGPLFANVPDPDYDYTTPPGLLGEIAQYIYASSPRQVKEIALAASIGFMAGLCGRAYNVSKTGLNQYVLLLAKTGTGKEGMVSGIDKILREVRLNVPAITEFLGPSAIASGQALIKHLATHPCFVSILGEFGLTLQALCSFNANPSQIMLRKTLLELYMKSGHDEVLRSTIYSDKASNTPIVSSPAFSMLGESTPQAYYSGLDETMIAQGLLPRFLCIEYLGRVPHLNKKHSEVKPSAELVNRITEVAVNALTLSQNGACINVTLNAEAQAFADNFSRETTDRINSSEVILAQELWNRAHLKMLKLAALIAVGINAFEPVITIESIQWAHTLVERDIKNVFARFERGQIGSETNESGQLKDVEELISDYLIRPYDVRLKNYAVNPDMHRDRVCTWSYLLRRITQKGSFRNDRYGATTALKRCIETLVLDGAIIEVKPMDMHARYKATAKAWYISDINQFINRKAQAHLN